MTQQLSSTDVWNDEIYCAICGAGFTQVVDLEFHKSAHDVKYSPSQLAKAAQAADYDEGEVRARNARQKWSERGGQQVEIELCNKNAELSVVAAIWRASATLQASD